MNKPNQGRHQCFFTALAVEDKLAASSGAGISSDGASLHGSFCSQCAGMPVHTEAAATAPAAAAAATAPHARLLLNGRCHCCCCCCCTHGSICIGRIQLQALACCGRVQVRERTTRAHRERSNILVSHSAVLLTTTPDEYLEVAETDFCTSRNRLRKITHSTHKTVRLPSSPTPPCLAMSCTRSAKGKQRQQSSRSGTRHKLMRGGRKPTQYAVPDSWSAG